MAGTSGLQPVGGFAPGSAATLTDPAARIDTIADCNCGGDRQCLQGRVLGRHPGLPHLRRRNYSISSFPEPVRNGGSFCHG